MSRKFAALLRRTGLRNQEIIQIHAELLCIGRIERMFDVDKGRESATFLRLRNHRQG